MSLRAEATHCIARKDGHEKGATVMPEIIVKLGDNVIQRYLFCQDRLTIGRAQDSDIVIDNLAVSRLHAVIEREGESYFVADQNSSNGTLINGTRVKQVQIVNRDVITVGKYQLYFFDNRAAADDKRRALPSDQERTMLVPVDSEPLPPEIVVTRGKQKGMHFRLAAPSVSIGRATDNMIRLTDWFVSGNHAVIERRGEDYVVRDLGSLCHTKVNGETVQERTLRPGDRVRLAPTVEFEFCVPEPAKPIAPPRMPQELAPQSAEPAAASPAPVESVPAAPAEPALATPEVQAPAAPAEPAPAVPEVFENVFDFPEENIVDKIEAVDEEAEVAPQPGAEAEAKAEPVLDRPEPEEAPEPEPDLAAAETLPPTGVRDVRAVMEDMAVVSLHIAAVETSQDLNRQLNLNYPAAAEARQQVDEIHMWENALQNKSLAIRKQAARRLKQLTGRDYGYE